MAAKWLDREMISGPYLMLALDEKTFQKGLRRMNVPRDKWVQWLADDSNGCVHTYNSPSGRLLCIVCYREKPERPPITVAGIFVHEAVHVFQQWCNHFEERAPSREFEAYSIEAISTILMKAYVAQTSRAAV